MLVFYYVWALSMLYFPFYVRYNCIDIETGNFLDILQLYIGI